ncbi:MAG: DUF397 domain-containing protein [Acidimicrobiales bacterium]
MKLLSITVDLSRARWRKSSFSGGGGSNCVEVADAGQVIAVRDSKDAPGPVLVFGQHAWRQFAANLKTER